MPLLSGQRAAGDVFQDLSAELAGRWSRGELAPTVPGEAGVFHDALTTGRLRLEDESAQVEVGSDGSLALKPKGQVWNVSVGPGQAMIGFDTKQLGGEKSVNEPIAPGEIQGLDPFGPEQRALSPARQLLEEEQYRYQQDNPDWWRPR